MKVWESILETATLAPSPHNVQPWRLRPMSDSEALLLIEKERTLPKEDVTGSFIILSMGLFIEAMRLVAAHQQLALEAELINEADWYSADHLQTIADPLIPFARLKLCRDPKLETEYDLNLFAKRRTSRLKYGPEAVPADGAKQLAELAQEWGQRYEQITDSSRIERLLDWNTEAVFEDLNHDPYRSELAEWIRYTKAKSARHRDGLDARCMHVSTAELWTAFNWPRLLSWPPLRGWFGRRYRKQIGRVSTLGLIAGPFWQPQSAYDTGRFLLRFWLECTRLDCYIHPYGNLVTNRPIAARVAKETGIDDIWLIFKIGRSETPPRSHRRLVEEVLS